MQWKPNVTVAAVVQDDQGRFLMVEEYSNNRLVYNQPAGHLEQGESLIDAVVRETFEETAYHFTPEHIVGFYMYPNSRKKITYLRVCFSGKVDEQNHDPDKTLDHGIVRAKWLTRNDLIREQEKHRSHMLIQCIDDYIAGKRYPLDLIHTDLD